MSTEHQQYSIKNQGDVIRSYAAAHGMSIVRTYADAGKSGLTIKGRDALQRLIKDVEAGTADFDVILVYDISRWGRFQDADEPAYYEYICRRANVQVQYCAEQFENDGSPIAAIVKSVKRAMTGEYSRELSVKVFAGQCRLIELGYRQGGPAGFGLRRFLIGEGGTRKGELGRGEHKNLQTDHVVLAPGPAEEIEIVCDIYRQFIEGEMSEGQIAADLNVRGIKTDLGRQWTRGVVHQILTNEKYIGNNVYNRRSFKLKKKRVINAPEMWIRANGVFDAIVDPQLFYTAQGIIRERNRRYSDNDMLDRLRELFQRHGYLSGLVIDETERMPASGAYQRRFGSLVRAYQLVGFTPDRDFRYIEINRALRILHNDIVTNTVTEIIDLSGVVERDPATDLLKVNGEFTASIVIARCISTKMGSLRWNIRFDTGLAPDISIAVRMDKTNNAPRDYYLLPHMEMAKNRVRLAENNGFMLDAYRFSSLDKFFTLARRTRLSEILK